MRLYVLAKDESGLRAIASHPSEKMDDALGDQETLRTRGKETTIVLAESLADLQRSHPSWVEELL